MEFSMIVTQNGRKYKVNVKRVGDGQLFEHFEVFAGGKSVTLRTNYNKRGKNMLADWKLMDGIEVISNVEAFVTIIRQMERHFDEIMKNPKPSSPETGSLFV